MLLAFTSPAKQTKFCEARHILSKSREESLKIKGRLEKGEDFAELAKECSTCASKSEGGDLGKRFAGTMDPAMDKACFDPETKIGAVVGPIETKFGFHLLLLEA